MMSKDKIKVDLIFLSKLTALTGLSTVVRNIMDGFRDNAEIKLLVWGSGAIGINDMKSIRDSSVKKNNKKAYFNKKIRAFLEVLAKNSSLISLLILFLTYFKNAKQVVNSYNGSGEIIFFHEIFTPYMFYKLKNREWENKRKIIVLHCDGDPVKMLFGYYPMLGKGLVSKVFFSKLLNKIFSDVESIILLGKESKKRFDNLYPEFKSKSMVVPNGLKDSNNHNLVTKKQLSKIQIVTVGSVGIRKGHDLLITALKEMSQEQRDKFELHIVGDGLIKNSLNEICQINNIENVFFHGAKTEVIPYLVQSDLFILASRDEGLPMAIIEAMRESLPIIATKVGDCADLLENNNGWLIDPNVQSVKVAILSALDNVNLIEKGAKSRELYLKRYSLEAMIDKYEKVFLK